MQDCFRINVSLNGRYLFATEQEHLTTEAEALKVFNLFREKFPETDGYNVTCRIQRSYGREWDFTGNINDTYKEPSQVILGSMARNAQSSKQKKKITAMKLLHNYADIEGAILRACSTDVKMLHSKPGYERQFDKATQSLDIIADLAKMVEAIKFFRH